MQSLTTPKVLAMPFAENGLKNEIPVNATGTNEASLTEGFPEITMKLRADGGLPPKGKDFNGLGNLLSSLFFNLQNGGRYTFMQEVSDAIGGYPQGAILTYKNTNTGEAYLVESLIQNNTYNFVTTPSYIDGVKWKKTYNDDLSGAISNVVTNDLTANMVLVSDANGKIAVSPTISSTELEYLNNVTSNIQTQINGKQATITNGSTVYNKASNLQTNRALISNSSGNIVTSVTTSTQLGYLAGVTSAIQTQLNNKVGATFNNDLSNNKGYITFSNKFQICWGLIPYSSFSSNKGTQSFANPFAVVYSAVMGRLSASDYNYDTYINTLSPTQITLWNKQGGDCYYIVVGRVN